MAMSVVYSNFCGRVVSETRGGVESDYVSDPLGSTIGLMNSAGTMTDRWEYWPYGEVVSRSGSNPTPLTWLGVIGYFQDVLSKLLYVRARHLRADLTRWLTTDPKWPGARAYGYAGGRPTYVADPTGCDWLKAYCLAAVALMSASICALCVAGDVIMVGSLTIVCTELIIALCATGLGTGLGELICAGDAPPPPPETGSCVDDCMSVTPWPAFSACMKRCQRMHLCFRQWDRGDCTCYCGLSPTFQGNCCTFW